MSAQPTEEDFRRHVGTKFRVRVETPSPLELELTEVKSYNPQGSEQSEQQDQRYGRQDAHPRRQRGPERHPREGEVQPEPVPSPRP